MKDKKKLQKILVDSANNKISELLKDFCIKEYNSEDYYKYLKENMDAGVIEIPNPQIWVEDDFITNSTVLSLMNLAKEPYSFKQQTVTYDIPADEKNFNEGDTARINDSVFYTRFVAECLTVLKKLDEFYPTHTVTVHDFLFTLFVLWKKATFGLLKRVPEHFKKFFTHHMLNTFMTSLVCPKSELPPNIKLIMYDVVGIMCQCSQRKFEAYTNRFKTNHPIIATCEYSDYEKFIEEIIAPLRSVKAVSADFRYWDMEYREVARFSTDKFCCMEALMRGQIMDMNKATHEALFLIGDGKDMKYVLKFLKPKLTEDTYEWIRKCYKEKETCEEFKHQFLDKNVKKMEDRGVVFKKYKFSPNLLPNARVISEVIINMDKFREQYPSCTEQQFTEVYLMAQTINNCKRGMGTSYKNRQDWALCINVREGSKDFEFTDLAQELTDKARSEKMDNYILRIE